MTEAQQLAADLTADQKERLIAIGRNAGMSADEPHDAMLALCGCFNIIAVGSHAEIIGPLTPLGAEVVKILRAEKSS